MAAAACSAPHASIVGERSARARSSAERSRPDARAARPGRPARSALARPYGWSRLASGRHHGDVDPGCLPRVAPPSLVIALFLADAVRAGARARTRPSSRRATRATTATRRSPPTSLAVAAAHPDIVQRFSIGKSYQGREMWAAKISDNVTVDENEPEVLFDGGTHSDEHMGVEMTLHILHWLVDGYGKDPRITNIVDTREIWIVFMVNPDGAEYDISGGKFHFWRKNRQPTPGTTVDRHGPQPQLRLPLGRRRADELEPAGHHLSRAQGLLRPGDPGDARLPGQPRRQRPSADPHGHHVPRERPAGHVAIRLHDDEHPVRHDRRRTTPRWSRSASTWPRPTATSPSRRATSTSARARRATTSTGCTGSSRTPSRCRVKDYPDDSLIASETGRNKEAVLYLMERAWCPLAVLGDARPDRALRRLRRRLRGPARLDREPRRDRHRASTGAVRAGEPGAHDVGHGPKQLGTTHVRLAVVRDRRGGRVSRRTPTTSTAGRPSARRRSRCRRTPASG